MSAPEQGGPRVAYLNTEYPALSHTFIEREVRAVRAGGVGVETFSIRKPGAHSRLGAAHEAAAQETFYILESGGALAASVAGGFATSPLGFLRALAASQRLAPPGLRARLTHLAYACEAVRLARELRRRGLGHIHVHMANNGAAVAMLACAFDRTLRYSLSIHGSAEFFHVDSWRLSPKAENALFVRCISDFCRAQVMTWTSPAAWDRYHVVHCGIDPTSFAPRPARRSGPLRLLTVGRLHPIKGYHMLLEAVGTLVKEGVDLRLDMVGDGPMRAVLERRAGELGLAGHVCFSGAIAPEAIGEHYDRADAMVVSSFMEGVPVVLMEAMAKELGVVATRVGGIPELVEDGVSGLLVNPGSADALAGAIRALAADPGMCHRHGTEGRRRVTAAYAVENVGAGMVDLFRRYLGESER